jgi:hypothetical protein
MPTARSLLAALALTFAVGACDRDAPTSPAAGTDNQAPPSAAAPKIAKQPLVFPVSPTQSFTSTGSATVVAGTVFTVANVQITKFYYENGQLFVDGGLYDQSGALISRFTHVDAELTSSGSPTQPTCQILNLDIGAIHLNLLGLVVDLAPIHLDITAESGPGNLLGNLLCALVNLLNQQSPLQTAITDLLNTINNLLSALLGSL